MRNIILAAIATIVVWQGPEVVAQNALPSPFTTETIGLILTIAIRSLLAIEGWFLLNVIQQNGRLLVRIEAFEGKLSRGVPSSATLRPQPMIGLPIGMRAPSFQLPDLSGEKLMLDALRSSNRPLMLFS